MTRACSLNYVLEIIILSPLDSHCSEWENLVLVDQRWPRFSARGRFWTCGRQQILSFSNLLSVTDYFETCKTVQIYRVSQWLSRSCGGPHPISYCRSESGRTACYSAPFRAVPVLL